MFAVALQAPPAVSLLPADVLVFWQNRARNALRFANLTDDQHDYERLMAIHDEAAAKAKERA